MDTAAPPRTGTAPGTDRDPATAAPTATGADTGTGPGERVITTLDDLCDLVRDARTVYLRFSSGSETDRGGTSRDGESGLDLPDLTVHPLTPERWWTGTLAVPLGRLRDDLLQEAGRVYDERFDAGNRP